jgi:Berberine and berberine like
VAPRDDEAGGNWGCFPIGKPSFHGVDKSHHGQWCNAQFLGRHEPPARVAASFGENWERLVALKKQYDPMGLFRNTFWPLDKDGAQIDPSEHEPPEPEF